MFTFHQPAAFIVFNIWIRPCFDPFLLSSLDLVVELMLDYERLVISRFRPLLYKVYLLLSTENEKPGLFKRGGSETSKRHKEGRYLENKLSTSVLIISLTGGNCDSSILTHSES